MLMKYNEGDIMAKILVDIGHPAHVHFFRASYGKWKKNSHSNHREKEESAFDY